ncbi:hypothetical protein [Magnetospira thiophila]
MEPLGITLTPNPVNLLSQMMRGFSLGLILSNDRLDISILSAATRLPITMISRHNSQHESQHRFAKIIDFLLS